MNLQWIIAHMADNAARIKEFVGGVSPEQARWKPDDDSWSILEVVCHLLDEEKLDFKVRLDIILHHPDRAWPPIDPVGWVSERNYNEQNPAESLQGFLSARAESLDWLRQLDEDSEPPDWDATYKTSWGTIRAGDMLAAWVAHDLLHLRQLVELHWAWTNFRLSSYNPRYAGKW
jgi:hypothetical protein